MRQVCLQTSEQISRSRFVLELFLSPMTIIDSQRWASRAASLWRFSVALHIVSKISQFVHSFFIVSTQFFPIHGVTSFPMTGAPLSGGGTEGALIHPRKNPKTAQKNAPKPALSESFPGFSPFCRKRTFVRPQKLCSLPVEKPPRLEPDPVPCYTEKRNTGR